MKLVKQINNLTCGQASLAMILNITIQQAIELIGHETITTDTEITKALGVDNIFDLGKPPKVGLYLQKHRNPDKPKQEHWTVLKNGQLFDPACIGPSIWPVYKYLKVSD